jgi:hypothetical protein
MYCVNLVHSRIDIFDSNHERTEVYFNGITKSKERSLSSMMHFARQRTEKNTRCQTLHASNTLSSLAHYRDTSMMMHSLLGRTSSYGTGTHCREP